MEDATDLSQMFQEEAKPPPPPPTVSRYQRSGDRSPKDIDIRLVGSHPLWGHHLWNAAKCFADFLDEHANEFCQSKRVLELGAGGGLPSIVSALNGASQVVITDYPDPELVENIGVNVQSNTSTEVTARVNVQGHVWGKDVTPLLEPLKSGNENPKFDVILLSDLIFNHSQHLALLKNCEASLEASRDTSNQTPCLLVFFTHHRPWLIKEDLAFFDLAKEYGWKTDKILHRKMEAMFKDDPGDEDVRATVEGWRIWR